MLPLRNAVSQGHPGRPTAGLHQQRATLQVCKASEPPAPAPTTSGKSKEDILARINRAKQYSKSGGPAAPTAPSPTQLAGPGTQAPSTPSQSNPKPKATDWGAMVGFLEAPVQQQQQQGASSSAASLPRPSTSLPSPITGASSTSGSAAAEKDLSKLPERFLVPKEQVDFMKVLLESERGPGRGSAYEAADVLKPVLEADMSDVDTSMRMEEITEAKEARMRAMGADVLVGGSVGPTRRTNLSPDVFDATIYAQGGPGAEPLPGTSPALLNPDSTTIAEGSSVSAPGQSQQAAAGAAAGAVQGGEQDQEQDEGGAYRPSVSTWGMFPRPADISKAYGGGRNLKPGQEIETPEQRAEREAQYSAALRAYRARAGLEVDPVDEAAAMKLYDQGMELFTEGALKAAYEKFDKATGLVNVKTKVGGLATLQKAITLDSLGYSEEAQKLYKSIQGHAVAAVSKKAKQMLFGFEAAKFLNADKISYAVKKTDYLEYFRKGADRSQIYVASPEELERDARNAQLYTAVALAVVLGPVLLVGGLALTR